MPKKGKKDQAKRDAQKYEETIYFHEAALSGYTYPQIADMASTRFGRRIGRELVRKRIIQYREARVAETVDELRAKQADELARLKVKLTPAIAGPIETELGDTGIVSVDRDDQMKGIAAWLKIAEREAKLWGLDAPAAANVTVTNVAPVDLDMEALALKHLEARGLPA